VDTYWALESLALEGAQAMRVDLLLEQ
jgi:hypothetical protein